MKDKEIVQINGLEYQYNALYQRLEVVGIPGAAFTSEEKDNFKQQIACPKCYNRLFTLSYIAWGINANCKCGHSMIVYTQRI